MAETVQCPVCTLYLHAGMNLSDHLETHPKEQVIKALVQMTISGACPGNSNMLSSVLNGEKKKGISKSSDLEDESATSKDIAVDANCASNRTNDTSSSSLPNQSVYNSQNSKAAFNSSEAKVEPYTEKEQEKTVTPVSVTALCTAVKTETTNSVALAKINVEREESLNQCFSKQNFNQTISVSSSTSNASHVYHRNSIEVANATNVHNTFNVFGVNDRFEQQQRTGISQTQMSTVPHMPPPPPPPPTSQIPHPGQHHDAAGRAILPIGASGTFNSMQPLQLPPPLPPHHSTPDSGNSSSSLRQTTQMYQSGQHQQPPTNLHHTQSLKVIYTPNLPPPPPLQLFSYQSQTHLQQHQKPPPAYGTAISQIRSQNIQSKQQVAGSLITPQQQTLQQHSALQQQQEQQSQQHMQPDQGIRHNIRLHLPPQPPPLPVQAKNIYSAKNNDLLNQHQSTASRHSQSQQLQQQSKVDLSQHKPHSFQQEHPEKHFNSESSHNADSHTFSSHETINKGQTKELSSVSLQSANVPASYPQVSISPSIASTTIASVAASTLARHTNSPFAALLAAAAGAPSPSNTSSVLRYAESPVAHYLERENGDFIVQETPKHIVECVETDNGEFSVIERIYQSPPSVLHIHDDDDDDENVEDNSKKESGDEKHIPSESKSKQQNDVEGGIGKNKDDRKLRESKISMLNAKIKKTKSVSDDSISVDDDIADFVSISSDSSDEEEFISHKQKSHKNTTENNKKNLTSSSSTLTMSTTSIQSSAGSDHQSSLASATTSLHNSPSFSLDTSSTTSSQNHSCNNSTSNRKKSSKNTITVLSDVQLNLNEYLDLVGNIIASSKVAGHRKPFTAIAPIPLVKIEKEEPIDEYLTTNANTTTVTETTISQNFESAPPLMANKLETEEKTEIPNSNSIKQTTNNHNVILPDELKEDENDDKKPQLFVNTCEKEVSIAISNASSSIMNINSSQVTSVIRMATTSQNQQQEKTQKPLHNNKNYHEAEDLSQSQQKVQTGANSKTLSHIPLTRKGPKKLIIKPKSTKTDILPTTTTANKPNQNQVSDCHSFPSTSKSAREEYEKQSSIEQKTVNPADVKIKKEPMSSTSYGNPQHQLPYPEGSSFSILEHHLSSKEPILEIKEEKPCITEANLLQTSIIKEMKIENNVNDDARVLYDFANSKKSQNEKSSTFPSPTSLFASKQILDETIVNERLKNQSATKAINHENETSCSTYSSQSMMDASMPTAEQNDITAACNTEARPQHEPNPLYTDFHFNYIYNNSGSNTTPVANDQIDVKTNQFSSFYQNSANNNTMMLREDSSSSKHYTDYQHPHGNQGHLQQLHNIPVTSHDQWFNTHNYHTSEHNVTPISSSQPASNINSGLSIESNTVAMDGSETNKYLDLDSCKEEQNVDINVNGRVPPPPPPSSSTSCSFNGITDNSMAGGCSSALNIRTDEKMPAKGEISEQESNCDIDNSWSQPIYGDISARFFKTTFPTIFPPDSGWNHDEYFTVQDLSASTNTSATTGSTGNRMKSFEQITSNNDGISIFSQTSNDNCNIDTMPSTSTKIRKKRKRSSQDGSSPQSNVKRAQPTSTVTSQEMLNQHQNQLSGVEFNFQNQQQNLPSTSIAFLAGPSSANTALAPGFLMQQQQQPHQSSQPQEAQQKQRTKVYECGHCDAKYSKLKDRNAHMIDAHNYIRQNRRLICPATGLATPLNSSNNQDVALPTTSAAGSLITPTLSNENGSGDYKQGIVKIEIENPHRDLTGIEPINADLSAKTEFIEEDKQNLALVPVNPSTKVETVEYDTKPPAESFSLSLTTASSKLITMYRMLVSFNLSTLKQEQGLSELDENLIQSSIFFCYTCRQKFSSVKLYDAHLTEHPAECFTCGKKFRRWKNFSLHLKRHLGWKEFGCTVCEKKFVVRSALVEHMRMHSGLSPLKCKFCGKHFKRYSNLTQHRKRHTKQLVRRKEYVCYCGEVLPSKARFLWHKETHDLKPKCCPHCCDRFVHVNSLRRHIRLAHSDKFDYTEPMECPICKQIFAKASMKAHMATHSTEAQYDCTICNKSFSTKWNLKIHSWVHANRTAKPFKCEHCPKAFVREVDFKNHMNSHKQIKPYTCEVCGCKFIRKYNYMRHRREHHGNKKYTCDLCKKSFHRHYYLIEHRRIHTGERPFQCSICGKSSTTKTNHNKHLKIHHSRDPFTVEV